MIPDRFVYFVRPVGQDEPIKIGCSRSPRARVEALLNWSPVDLEIMAFAEGDMRLEFCLHRMFAAQLLRKEWFSASAELIARIDRVRLGESIVSAFDIEAYDKPDTYHGTRTAYAFRPAPERQSA